MSVGIKRSEEILVQFTVAFKTPERRAVASLHVSFKSFCKYNLNSGRQKYNFR